MSQYYQSFKHNLKSNYTSFFFPPRHFNYASLNGKFRTYIYENVKITSHSPKYIFFFLRFNVYIYSFVILSRILDLKCSKCRLRKQNKQTKRHHTVESILFVYLFICLTLYSASWSRSARRTEKPSAPQGVRLER